MLRRYLMYSDTVSYRTKTKCATICLSLFLSLSLCLSLPSTPAYGKKKEGKRERGSQTNRPNRVASGKIIAQGLWWRCTHSCEQACQQPYSTVYIARIVLMVCCIGVGNHYLSVFHAFLPIVNDWKKREKTRSRASHLGNK